MGGALIQGWSKAGAFAAADLIVRDPNRRRPPPSAGATVNPPLEALSAAKTVLLAVKPRTAARGRGRRSFRIWLPDAVIVSIAAGCAAADIADAFGGGPWRGSCRPPPSPSAWARRPSTPMRRRPGEGPCPARSGGHHGRSRRRRPDARGHRPCRARPRPISMPSSRRWRRPAPARAATRPPRPGWRAPPSSGAAALLGQGDEEPAELRRQVTSPGGTTQRRWAC